MIEDSHDGKVNDTRWGVRMRGEGSIAGLINMQFKTYTRLYGLKGDRWELDISKFMRPGEQGKLF